MKVVYNEQQNVRAEITKVSERPYYSMRYDGDYGLKEYVKKGSATIEDYCKFVDSYLIQNQAVCHPGKSYGCSAFTAKNPEGDILFARNMDCECAIPMRIVCHPSDGYRSLAFLMMEELEWDEATFDQLEEDAKLTLAAPYSPKDGINEYGLAVACLTDATASYPVENEVTLFDEVVPRLILDHAKNVEEAIQLVEQYNFFYEIAPLHFMVADANGDSAVIEFVDKRMVSIKKSGAYQIASNFTLYQNPEHEGFGKDRYERMEQELERSQGIISEQEALELLKKNVIPGEEQWSAVYNLTKKRVMITFAREYQKVYEYRL